MAGQKIALRMLGALLLLAFGASSAGATGSMSICEVGAQETRLESIAYRIATSNVAMCSKVEMLSGLIVHDLSQYPLSARGAVSQAFSLGSGIGVLGIVSGSGADVAGLRIDDEILAVGTVSVEDPSVWQQTPTGYNRIDAFHAQISDALRRGPVTLTILRQGRVQRVTISGKPGCGGWVKYVDSGRLDAWSDGRHVVINRGVVDMGEEDDEIAFVIAHEMAHNILGHSGPGKAQARALFGHLFKTEAPKNIETQADTAAVTLMRVAGFRPEGGVRFLQTAQRRLWWAISLDHPSFGSRIRSVTSAIAHDRALAAATERLVHAGVESPVPAV